MVARQSSAQAQQEKNRQTGNSFELYEIDRLPSYPGGEKALSIRLTENIEYPAGARRDSVEGIVAVKFVIDDTGTVTGVNRNMAADTQPDLVEETSASSDNLKIVSMKGEQTGQSKSTPPAVSSS